MSKQKQQSSIRVHQVNNFKNREEMMQYADAQALKLQTSEKDLIKVKGISQGNQNVLSTQISQSKTQNNKTYERPNVTTSKETKKNTNQILIESFKSTILQKFQIIFKDDVILTSSQLQRKSLLNKESPNKDRQFIPKNKIATSLKKKESKTLQNPQKQKLLKDQQQLELLQYQKNNEKEQLLKNIESENLMLSSQNKELQYKKIQLIEYQRIIEQNIQELKQQIQKQNPGFNIQSKNEYLQKRMTIFINQIEKVEFNIVKVDLNFDEYVKNYNKRFLEIQQQINEHTLLYQSQNQDSQKKVISRRHNFEQFKQQNGKDQFEEQTKGLKQEKQKLEQEYSNQVKQCEIDKNNFKVEQDQMRAIIQKLKQEIMNNNSIEEKLKKKQNELNNLILQQQEFEQIQQNKLQQIRQNQELLENTKINYENQISQNEKQLKDIKEKMNQLENEIQIQQNINIDMSFTQSQMQIYNLDPINDLIEMYQNNRLPLGLNTRDEIINQEQKKIMVLEFNNIICFTNNNLKINMPYQTKWITQESILSQELLNNDLQYIDIEQTQNDLISSDQINGFAELLQIKDSAFYFRLPKKFRQLYPRLYILPSSFLEQFRIYYKQNKDFCINEIINQFEDFQAIQYQFWLIYQKIAFIIKEDSIYYLVTVNLNNRLLIIYNSIPKQQQQYYEIQLCLNYLFSQLLKENIQFQIHVSPIFPIQNNQFNNKQQYENLTGYYACIALEYYSKNQVNKNFLETNEIKVQIENIKLKKNKPLLYLRQNS